MLRLLIALALVAAVDRSPDALQRPADAPDVPHVLRIDVVAVDRDGNPVSDLKPEDLEVWVAGFRVPVERLEAVGISAGERAARSVVLLLDDITVPPMLLPRVREAARRFVNRLGPDDRMAIVALNGDAMKSTSDRTALFRRIDSYNVRAAGPLRPDDLGAHVLNTIAELARQLAESPGQRRTLVAIGSGWLFDTPMPPPGAARDLQREWVNAVKALAFARANLYIIDPGGVGTAPAMGGRSGFARDTGGHAFINTNDVNAAADRIIGEATSYYVIGIADPPVHRKAELRELDVRALRRGITIRARRHIPGAGY